MSSSQDIAPSIKLPLDTQVAFEDHPDFNEWLNSRYPTITFGDYSYDPAEVLFKTDPTAYAELLNDFQTLETEEDALGTPEYLSLRRKVCDNYPPMIAYSCNRVFDSVKYKERLERLRDVWETTLHVLHAFAIAEYRLRRLKFSDAGIKLPNLFSDKIHQRVENVRFLLESAARLGVHLDCHNLMTISVLDDIANLNSDVRNEFSHVQSLSEWQAKNLFAEVLPKVKAILLNLENLEKMSVRRLLGIKGSIFEMEFEEFNGQSTRPQTRLVLVDQSQLAIWGAALQEKNTLTEVQGTLWTLSPFIYINRETSKRHYPELWFLKRKHGEIKPKKLQSCILEYEVMDSSNQETVKAEHFKADILDILSLFQ